MVLDSEYNNIYINKYAIDYFNLNLNSNKLDYSKLIHPDDFENDSYKCNIFFKKKQNTVNICRFKINNESTSEVYKWIRITRIYIDDNNFIHTFENIDEYKKLYNDLHQEKLKNDIDYKQKSIFLANMSHEIRTPINGIIGMLTLLDDTTLSNEQRDYTDMLRECSNNLMTVINDILDFSKLEAGKVNLDIKCCSLRKCIESTVDILSGKIYEKQLDFTYNIDNSIHETINIDDNRLKQILLNLLNNAIKFTDKGSIKLNISKIESIKNEEGTVSIKFSIIDTGCGIVEANYKYLFKSFNQLDNNAKINEGTGLGLVICKQLLKLMNGDIWIEKSEINKGSEFSFTINTTYCKSKLLNNQVSKNIEILKNRKILILDDNRENRLSLAGIVKKWGMIPRTFSSAIEALYMFEEDYSLGLIDVQMPEMSGKDFAIKLKKHENNNKKNLPLIALSSLGEIKQDYSIYFKAILTKPIKETKLMELCIDSIRNNNSNYKIQHVPMFDMTIELKNSINILIAEDVIINQRVLTIFLQKLGFINIDIVDDGKKCLEAMSKKKYDIILLDIRMPIMNGELVFKYIFDFYTSKQLVNNNVCGKFMNNKRPYIIAVTAYSQKEDREKYLKMGFDQYISKPIIIEHLDIVMNNFINNLLSN